MSRLLALIALALVTQTASATKACEELKTEIAAKLDAAGVKGYVIEILPNDKVAAQKVVGSCDGGSKKITYAKK